MPTTWEEFEQLGTDLAPKGLVLGSGVEPFLLLNFLVSGGCPNAMPVDGTEDTVIIDLTAEVCIRAAQMVDRMIANGGLSKVGPFDPAFTALATADKVPLMIGPTWFGGYVIKPSFAFRAGTLAAATPPRWSDQDKPLIWSWGGGTFGCRKDSPHPAETLKLLIWAAANSHPGHVRLRFGVGDAIAKTLAASVAGGGTIEAALSALPEELVNLAKLNGYRVQYQVWGVPGNLCLRPQLLRYDRGGIPGIHQLRLRVRRFPDTARARQRGPVHALPIFVEMSLLGLSNTKGGFILASGFFPFGVYLSHSLATGCVQRHRCADADRRDGEFRRRDRPGGVALHRVPAEPRFGLGADGRRSLRRCLRPGITADTPRRKLRPDLLAA